MRSGLLFAGTTEEVKHAPQRYWQSPPAQNASVAKSATKASADLVVSREVTASTCTTATETLLLPPSSAGS